MARCILVFLSHLLQRVGHIFRTGDYWKGQVCVIAVVAVAVVVAV